MNRDTVIAHAWKPVTEPPEGGFVSGRRYLGGYWDQFEHWRSNVYEYSRIMWRVAGLMYAAPDYWQDEPPPPVAVPPMPVEPPPGWEGSRLPPTGSAHTIPPPVAATPARSLRTLAAFVSAGKHYLTMNEATDMLNIKAQWYPVFNTPQGSWEPQFDIEYHNCIGYRFQRR